MKTQRRIMGDEDIRSIVTQAVTETLQNIGFTTNTPNEIQADLVYLRKARQGNDEVTKWVKRSILAILLSGLFLALWEGIKQLLRY